MKFEKVLKQIRESNKNVDKVLKAAKLQRCPKQGLSEETLFGMFAMLMYLALMALFILG